MDIFTAVDHNLGSLTALVNNAGITGGFRRVEDTEFDHLRRVMDVNVGGYFICAREAVRRMEAMGMVIDIAHCSHQCVAEVLAMARRPVVSSHGGVQAPCPGSRNLTDSLPPALIASW